MAIVSAEFIIGTTVGSIIGLLVRDVYRLLKSQIVARTEFLHEFTPWQLYRERKTNQEVEELQELADQAYPPESSLEEDVEN